jgi:hypothetical protein
VRAATGGHPAAIFLPRVRGEGRSKPALVSRPCGGVGLGLDEVVVFGASVQEAQGADEVFGGRAAGAGVTAGDDLGLDVLAQGADVGRGDLVQALVGPLGEDLVPLGAIHAAGDRLIMHRHHRPARRCGYVQGPAGGQACSSD